MYRKRIPITHERMLAEHSNQIYNTVLTLIIVPPGDIGPSLLCTLMENNHNNTSIIYEILNPTVASPLTRALDGTMQTYITRAAGLHYKYQ